MEANRLDSYRTMYFLQKKAIPGIFFLILKHIYLHAYIISFPNIEIWYAYRTWKDRFSCSRDLLLSVYSNLIN